MIKGILFDKDGTLLKIDTLWIWATRQVLPRFLEHCRVEYSEGLLRKMEEALGISGNQIAADSALAWMTYWDMADVLVEELAKEGIRIPIEHTGELLERLYLEAVLSDQAEIEPTAELVPFFQWLGTKGVTVGVATADTKDITMHCLKNLGIEDYFSYIGISGKDMLPKPYTSLCDAFCSRYHLSADEVAIVGDTPVDMQFARNCGAMAVGVLSGVSRREDLEGRADFILTDVSEIRIEWDQIQCQAERKDRLCRN